MPQYKPHPDRKTTKSRKTRKSDRNSVYKHNAALTAQERRARRDARRAKEEENVV